MRVLKNFLAMFCVAAILICVGGCGSDDSDRSDDVKPERTSAPASSPTKVQSNYLKMTPGSFVDAYNKATGKADVAKIVSIEKGNGAYIFHLNRNGYYIGGTTGDNGYLGVLELNGPFDKYFMGMILLTANVMEDLGFISANKIMDNISKGVTTFEENGVLFDYKSYGSEGLFMIVSKDFYKDEEEKKNQRQKAEQEAQHREKPQAPAQTNSSAPSSNDQNSKLSVGNIGMGISVDQMHQILGKEK